MADVAQVLGVGPSFLCRGASHELKPLSYDLIAEFEVWLEARALEAVERHRGQLDAREYRARIAKVHEDIAACHYAWDSAAASRALQSEKGMLYALWLSLRGTDAEGLTRDEVQELYRAQGEQLVSAFYRVNFPPPKE